LGALFGATPAAAAERPTRVMIEIGESANDKLDTTLVRRLIRLELADIGIPAPYDAPLPDPPPPLYVRIVDQDAYVSVELWERGLLRGERRVSLRAGPHLTARSIALVVAELAQRLAEKRRTEARAQAVREARARKRSLEKRGRPLFARFTVGAAVEGALVGTDTWLVGPGVDAGLRFDNRIFVHWFARGFTGRYEAGALQWTEIGFAPGYALRLSRGTGLDLGLFATAGALGVQGALRVDDSRSSNTWDSRAGVAARLTRRLSQDLELHIAAKAGATVRKVPITLEADETTIGGPWLGVELGITIDRIGPGAR
jgi:hypothetical protein